MKLKLYEYLSDPANNLLTYSLALIAGTILGGSVILSENVIEMIPYKELDPLFFGICLLANINLANISLLFLLQRIKNVDDSGRLIPPITTISLYIISAMATFASIKYFY